MVLDAMSLALGLSLALNVMQGKQIKKLTTFRKETLFTPVENLRHIKVIK